MRVLNRELLIQARRRHADAAKVLDVWLDEARLADWTKPADIKQNYASASFLTGNVVIFNIKGNRYRLAARIDYARRLVLVFWFGTHAEYDKQRF